MNWGEKSVNRRLCLNGLFHMFLLIFFFAGDVSAREEKGDPRRFFYKGNSLYEEGKYEEAIAQYSELLRRGLESGNLYYNLGNCYFKIGELGKAILNYERAKRFIPRDKDLQSNYNYARSLAKDNTGEAKRKPMTRLVESLSRCLTINEMLLLLSLLYVTCTVLVAFNLFLRMRKGYFLGALVIIGVVFIVISISLGTKLIYWEKEAIVLKETAEARFEPMERATVYFTLYEGAKVFIISTKDDWCKIKRKDGKLGWVEKSALERIQERRGNRRAM